jgi:hypothetical protein
MNERNIDLNPYNWILVCSETEMTVMLTSVVPPITLLL